MAQDTGRHLKDGPAPLMTHERYIQAISELAQGLLSPEDRAKLADLKLAYGAGPAGLRGITYFNRWQKPGAETPFIEVCAFGQESLTQLAGTTIHELAHALSGPGNGHNAVWRDNCAKLGLRLAKAQGMQYRMANFAPALRTAIAALPAPDDGAPVASLMLNPWTGKPGRLKSCFAGLGVRGGKATRSGAAYVLYSCACVPPFKVRTYSSDLDANCNCCGSKFACNSGRGNRAPLFSSDGRPNERDIWQGKRGNAKRYPERKARAELAELRGAAHLCPDIVDIVMVPE